jgi:hypothetical protein
MNVTLFQLIQIYKIKKEFSSISDAFHLLIIKITVEEICTESNKQTKAVFSSSSEKQEENWKEIMPKERYAFTRIWIAAG